LIFFPVTLEDHSGTVEKVDVPADIAAVTPSSDAHDVVVSEGDLGPERFIDASPSTVLPHTAEAVLEVVDILEGRWADEFSGLITKAPKVLTGNSHPG
jgi:hypothetical protein